MYKFRYQLKGGRVLVVFAALLLCFFVTMACNKAPGPNESEQGTPSDMQQTDPPPDQAEPQHDKRISTVEDMANIEGVLAVEKLEFTDEIYGTAAYQVLYRAADGTQLSMEIILPDDYAEASTVYPVLLYYPQIGWSFNELAMSYTRYGYIVIRPFQRGYGQSEGTRDGGGDRDLSDAQILLQICDTADFIKDKKIFVLGSSEGATMALRLYAEDQTERFTACAVVDVVTDKYAYCEMRGESTTALYDSLIGKTYEEAPEEYELRSPLYFYQKLNRPLLLLCYTQSPFISTDSIDQFYEQLCTVNTDVTYHKLDALSADFSNPGYPYLMSWLGGFDENN